MAGIIAGDYDVGHAPWSIGDGGDGFEGSLIVGQSLQRQVGIVSGEVGRRERNSDVPGETYLNAARLPAGVAATVPVRPLPQDHVRTATWTSAATASARPVSQRPMKTSTAIALGGSFNLTGRISLGLNWFSILDGRNTADFDAILGTITYTFDLYNLGGQ